MLDHQGARLATTPKNEKNWLIVYLEMATTLSWRMTKKSENKSFVGNWTTLSVPGSDLILF